MQEVIVYRSPVEAAFWHSIDGGQLVPIGCGMFCFFLMFLAFNKMQNIFNRRRCYERDKIFTYCNLAISTCFGIAVCYKMWL